ncbi:Histone deacetylase complex, catalytic component HDA1 [Ceraceosorus bombacis]|uniref:Histone deacetylase complex, catalytic component HDA1 n=1 Tax=Ceraceosorus bombacis TaxID=401625 RepID=A0A0P1BI64_9BASI|nr:Histone deacetylase complex, catalytic component HDA1 [Ceraceosorus bombacis]
MVFLVKIPNRVPGRDGNAEAPSQLASSSAQEERQGVAADQATLPLPATSSSASTATAADQQGDHTQSTTEDDLLQSLGSLRLDGTAGPASVFAAPAHPAASPAVADQGAATQAHTGRPCINIYLPPAIESHRYVRSEDVSLIVERPERVRAVNLGIAAFLARCAAGHDAIGVDGDTDMAAQRKADDSSHAASSSAGRPAKTDAGMEDLSSALASLDVRAEAKVDPSDSTASLSASSSTSVAAIRVHVTRSKIPLSHPAFADIHGEPVLELADQAAAKAQGGNDTQAGSAPVEAEKENATPPSKEAATDMVAKLAAAARGESAAQGEQVREELKTSDEPAPSGTSAAPHKLTDQAAPLYPIASQPRKDETYAHYLDRLCLMAPDQAPQSPPRAALHTPKKTRQDTSSADQAPSPKSDSSEQLPERESEVPLGWPQGDLYLCGPARGGSDVQGVLHDAVDGADGGSKAAIEASVGAIDRAVDGLFAAPTAAQAGAGKATSNASASLAPAFVVVRPPGHHCGSATPSGFCWVNNVLVGASLAQRKYAVDRIIVLDIDLHHGNGTQSIAWRLNTEAARRAGERKARIAALRSLRAKPKGGRRSGAGATQDSAASDANAKEEERLSKERDLQVFYGSLHDIESYPCEDGDAELVRDASTCIEGAHGQWIWNVHLEQHTTQREFEELYRQKYSVLLNKARHFARRTDSQPDRTLVIVSCGMDACSHEHPGMQRHGKSVPPEFYRRFAGDAKALAGDIAGGRLLSVLEGGYSDRALVSATLGHLCGLAGVEGASECEEGQKKRAPNESLRTWWDLEHLVALEKLAKKAAAPATQTSSRGGEWSRQAAWLQATNRHFATLEEACGRVRRTRSKEMASSAQSTPKHATPHSESSPRELRAGARARQLAFVGEHAGQNPSNGDMKRKEE